ncbi:hypothetical protein CPB85DRAFT_999168 [Mucidula mucida]|nr:hypothetical protein CPB85DRAFT_999168 [Mucidula mucida]
MPYLPMKALKFHWVLNREDVLPLSKPIMTTDGRTIQELAKPHTQRWLDGAVPRKGQHRCRRVREFDDFCQRSPNMHRCAPYLFISSRTFVFDVDPALSRN